MCKPQLSLLLLCLCLLSACSVLDTQTPSGLSSNLSQPSINWPETEKALNKLDRWSVQGKIGFRSPQDSFTAAINKWEQAGDAYVIDLSSTFLGLGATRLLGNSEILTILESGEEPISSEFPDQAIEQVLGFPLPIQSLMSWIKGIPAKSAPYGIEFDKNGLPKTLDQSGWHLSFSKHRNYQNLPLPGKIKLSNQETQITLVVKSWQFRQ